MRIIWFLLLIFGSLPLASCVNRDKPATDPAESRESVVGNGANKKGSPKAITESGAIKLAQAELAKSGRKADNYKVTVESDQRQWIIEFVNKGKYPLPGHQHAVTVEKDSGKATLFAGE